jgi:hypothetical protein
MTQQLEDDRRVTVRKPTMTLFTATLIFQTFDEAMEAGRELRAAGYDFEIREELDPYCHRTTFVEASRSGVVGEPSKVGLDGYVKLEGVGHELWKQLEAIIEPLDGDICEAGLIEEPILERQMHCLQ